ncbi:ABC transporter D family member 1, partial [Camellia lanceoleosa]
MVAAKAHFFQVLGGLWPLVSGHIMKLGFGSDLNKEIFYVPQRPYTAVRTLRDQLIYPLTADQEAEPLTHSEMVELLKNVDLEYLLDRYPSEKEINWGDELSLGEQQRMGMARLFYHKPKFAILDECTSAVTTDMEESFCAKVRAMGPSCITISHCPILVAFHDVVLSLDGEGGWQVYYKILGEAGVNMIKPSETERQSDAMAVQRAFASAKKDSSISIPKSQSYVLKLIAASPPVNHDVPLPLVPQLQTAPRLLPLRVAAMFKILSLSLISISLLFVSLLSLLLSIHAITTLHYLAVYLLIDPSVFIFLLKIHLLSKALLPRGRSTNSQVCWKFNSKLVSPLNLESNMVKNVLRKTGEIRWFRPVNVEAPFIANRQWQHSLTNEEYI